jgi:hypothetical protein
MSVTKKNRICPFNVRFRCLKCALRACKVVKDHIPMHPAVIWNSTAVLSLTKNQIFPFHVKHQWILCAGSLFRSRGGEGVVSWDTAVSVQPVLTKCCWNLHTNVVHQLHVTWAGSLILHLHIIMCDILTYMCSLLSRSAFLMVHVTA